MAKYNLTKNYTEIVETYGLFQNVTGNADIEITDDVNDSGIVLKPFQTIVIHQKVFARKIGIAGNCVLAVLPFQNDTAQSSNDDTGTTESSQTFDVYDDLFAAHSKCGKSPPLSVQETPSHYLVSVSKDSLKGQNKFLLQFDERKKD